MTLNLDGVSRPDLPTHAPAGAQAILTALRGEAAIVPVAGRPVDTTVVIPTFNESANVGPLIDRLAQAFAGRDVELLFVDDSTDDTPAAIDTAARTADVPVRMIHRTGDERAGGLASAVTTGIEASTAPFIVVMDADLQHPPEVAPVLRDTAETADLAVASRYLGAGTADGLDGGYRRLVSTGSTRLAQVLFPRRVGRVCTDPMTGFFCLRRQAVDLSRLRPRGFKVLLEILARHDLRVREVPFRFADRLAGQTKASYANGLQFLLQLASLRFGRLSRFALVGAVGTVVNLAVMAGALDLPDVSYLAASLAGATVSILFNFVLQERLVFADLRAEGRHDRAGRLRRHVGINGVEALLRLPLLMLLVTGLGMASVAAQALLLAVAFVARFVATGTVVYRPRRQSPEHAADTARQTPEGHTLPTPPTDAERVSYLAGPQHRWFFWAHAVSFAGIAYSLYGFARMQYWTLIFLIPLIFYAGETLLGLRTSTYKRRVTLPDHQFRVETWAPEKYPSVDVFLPTAGEDLELLENTYTYVRQIDYPGTWRVHVLDDMARPEVEALAVRYGFGYFARPGSEFKKAGNLRYAFDRTDGDHILILDADFVPRPDILLDLVPYMDMNDPMLGIVQSPQMFPTPKRMGWIERCAGATQEMFYRFIQPSRDAVNGAICVGTSALYRRKALDVIGGFPKIGHSEDVFTGFEMVKHGYHLFYVPVNATQGICPDAIDPFITQQYRWCEGSIELMKGRDFHTHPNLTGKMRLSFWAGFFYYFTTAMNAYFAPIPVLIMIWFFPQYVRPSNMLPLLGLLILWLFVYPVLMKSRWRLDVLRVQAIYGFTHSVAIYDVFAGKAALWVPSHGENRATPLAVKVKRIMAWYLAATSTLMLAGFTFRLLPLGGGYDPAQWWALFAFTAINLYVYGPVGWLSFRTLSKDRRAAQRDALREQWIRVIEDRTATDTRAILAITAVPGRKAQ